MKPPLLYAGGADWADAVASDHAHPDWLWARSYYAMTWETTFLHRDAPVLATVTRDSVTRRTARFSCDLTPTYVLPTGVPVFLDDVAVPLPTAEFLWRVLGSDRTALSALFAGYLVDPPDLEAARYGSDYLEHNLPDDWDDRFDRYWQLWDETVGRLPVDPLFANGVTRRRGRRGK